MAGRAVRRRRHRARRSPPPGRRPTTSCGACWRPGSPRCARQGTTTVEIKSGYGLTVDRRGARRCGIAARGHRRDDLPRRARRAAGVRRTADGYVDLVTGPMLRGLRAARPVGRRVLRAAQRRTPSTATRRARCWRPAAAAGLGLRVHGNQLGPGPGVRLAVELGAASVDHCTYLTDADVDALAGAAATTVATLLPGVEFSTRSPYPDAPAAARRRASRSRWPPTATRARATPRRCRS